LNSCDIRYTEGIQSLNWTKIMKTITDDSEGFFDQGGWSFLDPESDAEAEDMDDEDEDDEHYAPTDSGSGEDESESDLSGESDVTESDADLSDEELATSEESGKDWSELEEEARQADRDDTGEFADEYTKKQMKWGHGRPLPTPSRHGHSSKHSSSKHRSPSKNGSSHNEKRRREDSRDKHKHSSKKARR